MLIFLIVFIATATVAGAIAGIISGPALAAMVILTICLSAFSIFVIFKILKIWKNRPAIGEIMGEECEAAEDIQKGKLGAVIFNGEIWNAIPDKDVSKGDKLVIAGKDYWRLKVKKK
ncbi:MAG: hypothetical protein CVT47_03885 [Thermoplasmata archaeon HGW-Thermoplasmata-2]|nr:MAG: hypothetical protein CVT47_03885 [Thermoplasmata archaeon HGW-Thermoplasmata-2]